MASEDNPSQKYVDTLGAALIKQIRLQINGETQKIYQPCSFCKRLVPIDPGMYEIMYKNKPVICGFCHMYMGAMGGKFTSPEVPSASTSSPNGTN